MVMCQCCQSYATLCRVITHLWIVVGIIFSCLALATCDFVVRGDNIMWGLFSYGAGDECDGSYEDGFVHGWLHTWAAVCGALAPAFGIIVWIFMMLDCFCKVCCSSVMQTTLLSFAELSQAFTFLMYASEACITKANQTDSARDAFVYENATWAGCKMGNGTIYSIIAFTCYFMGGWFLCCSPKHDPLFCNKDDDSTISDKEESKKSKKGKEQPEGAADEENAAGEEVKPQVY